MAGTRRHRFTRLFDPPPDARYESTSTSLLSWILIILGLRVFRANRRDHHHTGSSHEKHTHHRRHGHHGHHDERGPAPEYRQKDPTWHYRAPEEPQSLSHTSRPRWSSQEGRDPAIRAQLVYRDGGLATLPPHSHKHRHMHSTTPPPSTREKRLSPSRAAGRLELERHVASRRGDSHSRSISSSEPSHKSTTSWQDIASSVRLERFSPQMDQMGAHPCPAVSVPRLSCTSTREQGALSPSFFEDRGLSPPRPSVAEAYQPRSQPPPCSEGSETEQGTSPSQPERKKPRVRISPDVIVHQISEDSSSLSSSPAVSTKQGTKPASTTPHRSTQVSTAEPERESAEVRVHSPQHRSLHSQEGRGTARVQSHGTGGHKHERKAPPSIEARKTSRGTTSSTCSPTFFHVARPATYHTHRDHDAKPAGRDESPPYVFGGHSRRRGARED
ncbi:hypothetical protein VTK73DRAFT_1633 [Phialemonium thermophilum]|uniref:Uncharacterized protein n=1 Tax=Phialemonium thermophilum TaxID=223376 RepID=A0ABR3VT64_9PEZI